MSAAAERIGVLRSVRRLCGLVAVLLLLPFAPAHANAKQQGIRGEVLDSTCYGPCVIDQQPQPYAGDGVVVEVRSEPHGNLVATSAPQDGRFRIVLPRGRYSIRAKVDDPLWESDEAQTLRVRSDEFERVKLLVWNAAIL